MNHRPNNVRRAASLRPLALAALTLCALSTTQARSEEPAYLLAQNLHAPQLAETVVTATRSEQPLSDLVADVSIVDRDTIASSGATGLADLLARLPGVEIARSGGIGNASSLYLRGADNRFTALYIDGVRIDSQSSGGALWEQIPLGQIERIEVLRGPAAAVYGSDAIGGVVQLFTRQGDGPAAPFAGVGLGNHGTRKVEAGVSGTAGPQGALAYALALAHARSSGYDSKASGAHNPDDDGYRSTNASARVGYRLDARHRFGASLLANRMNSAYDAFTHLPAAPHDDRNRHKLQAVGAHWAAAWSDAYSTRVSVSDSLSRYETAPPPYRTETRLRGYLWQNDWRLGAHRLSATLERREDHLDNPALDAYSVPLLRGRSQDGLGLGYGYSAGAHSVQLHLRHDKDSEFGGKGTGSVAYGYAFASHWRATASAGTAFRAPTLYQRFSQYGDPSLRPETSRNLELGLRYAQGATTFSAVAYRNRIANFINFAPGGSCGDPFGCYLNTGNAAYSGLTLSGAYPLGGIRLRGSLDWQNPHDRDTGKQLARRAKRHASLGAETQLAGWTLGAELQASGRRFDDAANTKPLGGYGLVNLYASTRIAGDYTLLARLDNAGNKDYELARTYATGGRQFYVALRWEPRP